jgi:hypothetical protein
MTDEEFDRETELTLRRIDAMIATADEDATKILASLNRFLAKADHIDQGEEHAAVLMAANFMLSDEVLHRHMNVFSIFSLLEILGRHDATAKALIRHAPNRKAREFVVAEWLKHREAYGGNKSEFARHYAARVWNELQVRVTEKQIREVWLASTPPASKPDGLPADGE